MRLSVEHIIEKALEAKVEELLGLGDTAHAAISLTREIAKCDH